MAYSPDYRDPQTAEREGIQYARDKYEKQIKAMRARYKKKITALQEEIAALKKANK